MQKLSSVFRRVCVRFAVVVFASLALAVGAWGQYNASIQGTVTDPSGAAVPNAKVTVTNQATGVSSQASTSTTGFYRIGQLPPGNETVTVSGATTPLLQTQDASVSKTLSGETIEALPALGRDPFELIRLTPGVFGDSARTGTGQSSNLPSQEGPGGSISQIFQTENQV